MKTILPRCVFVSIDGKRCRCRSALRLQLFLDSELYPSCACVDVKLCPEHYVLLGGSLDLKNRKS